jgi:hypothetical protein
LDLVASKVRAEIAQLKESIDDNHRKDERVRRQAWARLRGIERDCGELAAMWQALAMIDAAWLFLEQALGPDTASVINENKIKRRLHDAVAAEK